MRPEKSKKSVSTTQVIGCGRLIRSKIHQFPRASARFYRRIIKASNLFGREGRRLHCPHPDRTDGHPKFRQSYRVQGAMRLMDRNGVILGCIPEFLGAYAVRTDLLAPLRFFDFLGSMGFDV